MLKAKVHSKIRETKSSSDKAFGVLPTKRDPSKYKAMFDRLQQLEKKDSHLKEVKPVAEKPHPTPAAKPIKEAPKKTETKPTPAARVVLKKQKTEKTKEVIRVKAIKPTASRPQPTKKVLPKVTGKKISVQKSKQVTPKRVVKQKSSERSASSESRVESEKSNQVPKSIQKTQQSSKKRTSDPRDAIPKFEKFHRKPRAHVDEDLTAKPSEPKVRAQKPRQQKPTIAVVETIDEEIIEERSSPKKHVNTPVVLNTPQQTTAKKPPTEKKPPKVVSQKKEHVEEDLLLDEMLASNSKNVQQGDYQGLNMLTAMPESPPVESEQEAPEAQNLDELQEMLMEHSSPKKGHSSTKKSTHVKSSAKNEDSAKVSDSKRKHTKAEKSEPRKKAPEPILEEMLQEQCGSEHRESPANEPFSFIDPDPGMDELNDMMQARPAHHESPKKSRQMSSKKKESRTSTDLKVESGGFGILTGGFGGDDLQPEAVNEEDADASDHQDPSAKEEEEEEDAQEEENVEVEEAMDEEEVAQDQPEEVISSANNSPARHEEFQEPHHASASLFGNPPGMFSHPTGSLFGLQDDTVDPVDEPAQDLYRGGAPAIPDVIDNELDRDAEAVDHNSESSMESRHKGSSHSSSYHDKVNPDHAMIRSEEKEGHQESNSREGGKLILEPLNHDQDTSTMLLSSQVRNFDNEHEPIMLQPSTLNRSRTETPDKAFHDSSLDPQKLNSNSKVNDGTDFSFY